MTQVRVSTIHGGEVIEWCGRALTVTGTDYQSPSTVGRRRWRPGIYISGTLDDGSKHRLHYWMDEEVNLLEVAS